MSEITLSTAATGGEREMPKEGLAQAICIGIIDNGTVETEKFGAKRKVELIFELPKVTTIYDEAEGPVPMRQVSKFNLTLHPKGSLYKAVSALLNVTVLPEEVKLTDILGKNCMVDIKHSEKNAEGKQYANVASYSKLMDGLPICENTKDISVFFFDDFDRKEWDALPDWKREKLSKTPEGIKRFGDVASAVEAVADVHVSASETASLKPIGTPPPVQPDETDDLPF